VRVNLILSILVFQERKYCLHDNVKLVFFYKKYTKTIHTIKKNTRTVQVNCTVQNIQKLYTHLKKKNRTVQVNCTVHGNSAIYLHCSSEQCNSLALFATVQVNLHCLRAQCK
jgi:dipeptide/tripeptide permease